jgi:hypothetical protein
MSTDRADCRPAHALIPGAYERTTVTHRQPGSKGGAAFGSGPEPTGSSSMDAATIAERQKEGGGARSQRRCEVAVHSQAAGLGVTSAERTDTDSGLTGASVPQTASPASVSLAVAADLVGLATCPVCHTPDAVVTTLAVRAGADWQCSRCGQRWDGIRLATAAAYAVWRSAEAVVSRSHHDDQRVAFDGRTVEGVRASRQWVASSETLKPARYAATRP